MKILHCIPSFGCGGAERQLSYLAPELARMGQEVHIAYLQGGMNFLRVQQSRVLLHRLPGKSHKDPRVLLGLCSLVKQLRPDVIQTWNPMMDILGGIGARFHQTPWIIREPNNWRQYPKSIKTVARVRLGLRADAMISNSCGGDDYWASLGFRGPKYIITNALPIEEIDQAESDLQINGLNVANKQRIVLYAGRLDDKAKNIKNLFYALLPIVTQKSVIVIFCGDGPYKPELERMIEMFKVADKFILPGIIDPIWPVIKSADMFVSVSYYEGCPNLVLEAMACGCPLVVSDIPAHREILDDEAALLVSPDKPEEITKAIEKVLSDSTEAESRSRKAKSIVACRSVSVMAHQYYEVYQQVSN